jgi:Rad3-related DNA helicase
VSILKAVPAGWTLRPVQEDILRKIEDKLDSSDVFIIRLPVAGGKTLVAATIARYLQQKRKWKSRILVPNNMLLKQYIETFPNLTTLQKRESYTCELYEKQTQKFDCGTHSQMMGKNGKRGPYCKGCPYVNALRKSRVMPYVVINNYTYLAYKMYAEGLIIDEGHLMTGMIKDMAAKKLWHHDYQFPSYVRTYGQLYRWVCERLTRMPGDRKLKELKQELMANKVSYLVEKGTSLYRGEERACLKLIPVDVKNQPPLLWPHGKVKKLFFLSGTINRKDVEDMGLGDRRICVIDAPSPIPVENRPLELDLRFNLSASANGKDIPPLAEYLAKLAETEPGRGFIHAPYSLAKELEKHLGGHERFMFHTNQNKAQTFREFQETEGKIMVASGMYEGIDLAGDAARWQVITKVPWPNLMEPAMQYLAKQDPEAYANEAARLVVQGYGRVCRSPTDYGKTIIVDRSFDRLFNNYAELFPGWFKDAVGTKEESS